MQQVRLEVEKRNTFGKGNARALRRGGRSRLCYMGVTTT